MPWTTPTTVNPGDAILASLWNTQVKDNLLEFASFFSGWTAYTPTMTATTTNPNIGSTGAANGRYIKVGRMVMFTISITSGGSGIAAGSGTYRVSLPIATATAPAAGFDVLGSGWAFTTAGGRYTVAIDNFGVSSATESRILIHAANEMSSTNVNLQAGWSLGIMGHYQSAS